MPSMPDKSLPICMGRRDLVSNAERSFDSSTKHRCCSLRENLETWKASRCHELLPSFSLDPVSLLRVIGTCSSHLLQVI